jgi:UDPglucose 6-dehydrogenase
VSATVTSNPRCHGARSELEACEGADVLVIMTPWAQFSRLDPVEIAGRLRGKLLLDPYGVLNGDACAAAGLAYSTLGR